MTLPTTSSFEPVLVTDNVLRGYHHTRRQNKRAVLFVHGFTGNWEETWKSGNNAFFPELIVNDPGFVDYDVFLYQYKSTLLNASPIENVALQLRTQIDFLQKLPCRNSSPYEIVLVAHSLGGLACMKYIIDCLQDDNIPPISDLVLYGVPTTGTELVKTARILGAGIGLKIPGFSFLMSWLLKGQRQVADLETASKFLQSLHGEWAKRVVNGGYPSEGGTRMWLPVRVVTGDEDWVVSEASGKGVYGAIDWRALPYGHIALVKPDSRIDERYQPLQTVLERAREAKSPKTLDRLWSMSRHVWDLRKGKLIRNLRYRMELFSTPTDDFRKSWIDSGFAFCSTELCEYSTRLLERKLVVGVAIGNNATRRVWQDNPIWVHQINVDALPKSKRDTMIAVLDSRHSQFDAERRWEDVFSSFGINVEYPVGSGRRIDLTYSGTEKDGCALIRTYLIPEELDWLLGEDIRLSLTFSSIMPESTSSFNLFFPWLTDTCHANITVNGNISYFVSSIKAVDSSGINVNTDSYSTKQEAAIVAEDLLLPGTAIVLRWGLLDEN